MRFDARALSDPREAHATHATAVGGGRAASLPSRRRFCVMAANVNSNWALLGPRKRSRPSRRMRFRCAALPIAYVRPRDRKEFHPGVYSCFWLSNRWEIRDVNFQVPNKILLKNRLSTVSMWDRIWCTHSLIFC